MTLLLAFIIYSATAALAGVTLDPTFGTGGKVTTDFSSSSSEAHAILLQPDGKLVAVGFTTQNSGFALARYNANGSLDTTFDTDGIVIPGFGTNATF